MRAALALVALAGCSWFGVNGPGTLPDPPEAADEVHCTSSDVLPTIDALAGAGLLAAAAGGVIAEETGSHGIAEHWELYYALPMMAVSVAYFVASAHGTHAVEQCLVAKDPSLPPVQ